MSTHLYFQVSLTPYLIHSSLIHESDNYPRDFFVKVKRSESAVNQKAHQKALKMIKEICQDKLVEAFVRLYGISNLDETLFQTFLRKYKFETNDEDLTLQQIIDTALFQKWEQFYMFTIETAPSCEACRHHESGQKEHMEPGGCLYDPYIEELDDRKYFNRDLEVLTLDGEYNAWPDFTFDELKKQSREVISDILYARGLKRDADTSALWDPYLSDFDYDRFSKILPPQINSGEKESTMTWVDGIYCGVSVKVFPVNFGGKFMFRIDLQDENDIRNNAIFKYVRLFYSEF